MGFIARELEGITAKLQAGPLAEDERSQLHVAQQHWCGPWNPLVLSPLMT
jgi:hypothetical protein